MKKSVIMLSIAVLGLLAQGVSQAGTVEIDFSAVGGGLVYTITDPDAGSYTITASATAVSGGAKTTYDSGRGGGFRNSSQNGSDNSQIWSFAVTGLNASYEVTGFGVGWVHDIGSSTYTLDISNDADATTANQTGINSPSQPNQTSNNELGITGNFGNGPTFDALIDEESAGNAAILQINGLTIEVAPPAAATPGTLIYGK